MFGTALRRLRNAHAVSLAALASELQISVSYLLDIEMGRRGPLNAERLACAARFLDAEQHELVGLVVAAAQDRGEVCVPADGESVRRLELLAELAARWAGLSDADVERVGAVLGVGRAA